MKEDNIQDSSKNVVDYANSLKNQSFEGWSEDSKNGYLTAIESIVKYTTQSQQPKTGLICQGNCIATHKEHKGLVQQVRVHGFGSESINFNYCQNAIEEDGRRGFSIEIIDESGEAPLPETPKDGEDNKLPNNNKMDFLL